MSEWHSVIVVNIGVLSLPIGNLVMEKAVTLYKEPELKNPRLIMALPDTGYVGLRIIDYSRNKLCAEEFGRIEPYDFSAVPWISVKDGLIQDLEMMRKIYDELYEEAKKEVVYPMGEQPAIYPENTTATISDEELSRMMIDIEDFFKKGKQ